ncbi:cell wall binding protein [Leifsonia xyli subsp. cynodontis DSM 46306]|uniref:Uncharacterized protein n=1 Tax=Leifsonia xyli subsp. cynodontis DSM 46306 TaxID=1389489 RepID=U3P6G0_LEIXC|nr:hypothetical protein [Leifsonia xyli]AGW40502.1 cell wall binding protein [Leifsonia xyli subsp. cynodontis DSM 46306]
MTRIRARLAVVVAVAVAGSVAAPAYADQYPSWQDVQNAKANESAASAQVDRINGLIADLKN